jgi:type II secretory pathway pseudopilin PulG
MMAIIQLSPEDEIGIAPQRQFGRAPRFRVIKNLEIFSGERTDRRGFTIVIISIFLVGLLGLLVINTLLTQDAFVLQRLKHQTNVVNDQRDAIVQQVAQQSSPDRLAAAATKLGMIPATNSQFLDISKIPDEPAKPTKIAIVNPMVKHKSTLKVKAGN